MTTLLKRFPLIILISFLSSRRASSLPKCGRVFVRPSVSQSIRSVYLSVLDYFILRVNIPWVYIIKILVSQISILTRTVPQMTNCMSQVALQISFGSLAHWLMAMASPVIPFNHFIPGKLLYCSEQDRTSKQFKGQWLTLQSSVGRIIIFLKCRIYM